MLAAPLTGPASTLEYYRRLLEEPSHYNTDMDSVRAAGAEFGFAFSSEPLIAVIIPEPIASAGVVYGPRTGLTYGTRRIGTQIIAEMRRDDAAVLLKNPVWRGLNENLARDLLGETSA